MICYKGRKSTNNYAVTKKTTNNDLGLRNRLFLGSNIADSGSKSYNIFYHMDWKETHKFLSFSDSEVLSFPELDSNYSTDSKCPQIIKFYCNTPKDDEKASEKMKEKHNNIDGQQPKRRQDKKQNLNRKEEKEGEMQISGNRLPAYQQHKIFEELDQSLVQKKNKNFIKFLIRSYFNQIVNLPLQPLEIIDWVKFNKKIEKKIKRKDLMNMDGLEVIFNSQIPESLTFEKQNRKFMATLLRSRQFYLKRVLYNESIKDVNKRQYLLACKVGGIRCRSKHLINRQESR